MSRRIESFFGILARGAAYLTVVVASAILWAPFLIGLYVVLKWLYPLYHPVTDFIVAVFRGADINTDAAINPKEAYGTVRNILEITNFAGTTLLWPTALVAFVVTWWQLREAKKARLATIYTALEERWSSAEIGASRELIRGLITKFEACHGTIDRIELPKFIDSELQEMGKMKPKQYIQALTIIDLLEYIGVMEDRGYLDLEVLEPLIGEVTLEVYQMLKNHIETLQEASRTNSMTNRIPKVPETYRYFLALRKKFQKRFS